MENFGDARTGPVAFGTTLYQEEKEKDFMEQDIINICYEFEENCLQLEKNKIKIRIRKVFYADFVRIMRRKGAVLTKVNDKTYYIFLDFEIKEKKNKSNFKNDLANFF